MQNKPLTEFQEWPKIPRYGSPRMLITEKLDGTNACVVIVPLADSLVGHAFELARVGDLMLLAQSRNRFLSVGKGDNYGFAGWVAANASALADLGPGRWYGEWYGLGIGRGYGLTERRFALFNAHHEKPLPACVSRVPTLYFGPLDTTTIAQVDLDLRNRGSQAVPGYMSPEGVVIEVFGMPGRMKVTDAVQGAKQR